MDHLDCISWSAGLSFASFGACIGIRTTDPAVLPRLRAQLAPGWQPLSRGDEDEVYSLLLASHDRAVDGAMHRLYLGPDQLLASHDLDLVFDRFNSDVHHQVARHAREGLFVHAGVVGWNGRAIVLPGRSHSGKSSLVEAMVRAGALYYSDEYAVVDREGRVHPYAKPLSLRSGPHGSARTFCPPEAIGGQAGVEPLPIGLMAATRYNPGATWDIHPLSPGEAVLALLDNTVLARIRSGLALESLSRASAGIAAVAGARGEAAEAAPRLLQMLGRL